MSAKRTSLGIRRGRSDEARDGRFNKRLRVDEDVRLNNQHQIAQQQINTLEDALSHVRSLFPIEDFHGRTPPIIWKHQLYAILKDRTRVDRELNLMLQNNLIRFFRLGTTLKLNEIAIVMMNDYQEFVEKNCVKSIIVDKFMKSVVSCCPQSDFTSKLLNENYNLNEKNINELIRCGLLAAHHSSVGIWLLSIPYAGEFVKSFTIGRKAILNMIRKSKFQEITRFELMKRRLPKDAKLGINYHIYDMIGSDAVQCLESAVGTSYRISSIQSN